MNDALLSVSVLQALSVWEQLTRALYGDSPYAGDTAEIYVYTVMPHSPLATAPLGESGIALYRAGCRTLHGLCRLFEERMGAVVTMPDGSSIDGLLDEEPYTHRIHVKVKAAD